MTETVLDASALLPLLLGEPGAENVQAALDGAMLSAVNLAEIVSHYAKLGAARRRCSGRFQSGWRPSMRVFPTTRGCCAHSR